MIGIVVIAFLIISNQTSPPEIQEGESDISQSWQEKYVASASEILDNYDAFTRNTNYYDYNNDLIKNAAEQIAVTSKNSKQAIEKTLNFVYKNVQYVYGEPDNNCFDGTAPSILASGRGQCDTQSIVVISILRKMGIASAPVGGCIYMNPACYTQALFLGAFEGIGLTKAPKYEPAQIETETGTFSRSQGYSRLQGITRQGGLHAFVVAWDSENKEWLTLEATSGKIADTNCWSYHAELIPKDNEKNDICVSVNKNYAQACQKNDINTMNKNGLGLVQDINPSESRESKGY